MDTGSLTARPSSPSKTHSSASSSNIEGHVKVLKLIPCANYVIKNDSVCPKAGIRACSACHLVSYCSKECQVAHWAVHKRDCKSDLQSPNWKPEWVIQRRKPSFFLDDEDQSNIFDQFFLEGARGMFGLNIYLWGNMPAIDILNLSRNEGTNTVDTNLNIAFIASGDLRNLMRTVNGLPENYSGKLSIVLNDRQPMVVIRNIILLLILGQEEDQGKAVELALHFWYSSFIQEKHEADFMSLAMSLLERLLQPSFSVDLGPSSTLHALLPPNIVTQITHILNSGYGFKEAKAERDRVFLHPSRVDLHHKRWLQMEPSHRSAFERFRRSGVLLPYGVPDAHFKSPNRFLFSAQGEWLQNDGSNPLDSWDLVEVLAAGRPHGVQRADIFGSLYFYLSDQLRTFADRLKRLNISFHLFDGDASELAEAIRSTTLECAGIPADTYFDRIEVSNIFDAEYVGIAGVLSRWGSLLNRRNNYSTIVGSLMNWVRSTPGGSLQSCDPAVFSKLIRELARRGRISPPPNDSDPMQIARSVHIMNAAESCAAIYDNSGPFAKYLEAHGTSTAAKKAKLRLKNTHTAVPHRLFAPLNGPINVLPNVSDDESWYLRTRVGHWLFTERFVEFGVL